MIVKKGDKILISWDNFKYLFILYQIAKLLKYLCQVNPFLRLQLDKIFHSSLVCILKKYE